MWIQREISLDAWLRQIKQQAAAIVTEFLERHYADYWLRSDTQRQMEHLRLAERASASGTSFATSFKTPGRQASAPNRSLRRPCARWG